MMVPLIDVILIVFLAGFVFYGLFSGLIKTIGYLAGFLIGSWFAAHYYLTVYNWLDWMFFGHENVGKVITFILVMTIVGRLVGFGFYLLEKAFNLLTIIPLVKPINKLLGGLFGLIEGLLTLGLILYVSSRYAVLNTFFANQLIDSHIAPLLVTISNILTPLIPETLQYLQSLI